MPNQAHCETYPPARQQEGRAVKIAMPDGCLLHVETSGQGDQSIILLHGIMMSGEVFRRQLDALSKSRRVMAVDLRGFGQSDKPASGYFLDTYVDDLKHLIDRLELVRPVIAGWSIGGLIAMAFAAKFPQTLSRLFLIGTSPCLVQRPDWPDAVPPAAAEQPGQLLATDYAAGVDAFCDMMFPEQKLRGRRQFYPADHAGDPTACDTRLPPKSRRRRSPPATRRDL
jgi:pimeloyl-ACP methyl ester carboxylesterase